MNETLTGFAALALLGFVLAFGLLMMFMALVQPIWCLVDCAIDRRRGAAGKVLWILALILLWGVAGWFYGAFAASNKALLVLTRLAWALAIGLAVAFAVVFHLNADFRRGVEKEWRGRGGLVTRAAPQVPPQPQCRAGRDAVARGDATGLARGVQGGGCPIAGRAAVVGAA